MTNRSDLTDLPQAKLVEIIIDLLDRVESIEAKLFKQEAKCPPGYLPLKAVDQFGLHKETIRKRAIKGRIGAMRQGSRWYIKEDHLKTLAEKFNNLPLEDDS
jgi:excisionase family DNA binding protein